MGNQVRGNSKKSNKKKGLHETIGILSFEVANAMSKIIHLHKSLSENEILKLKNQTLISDDGIKTLISDDEHHLLNLSLREKLDDLTRISGVVSRLGKKCTIPALQRFEHVYADVISGVIGIDELSFLVKDMDSMIKKMERYVGSTVALYAEMEVVNELELAIEKFERNGLDESRRALEQKLTWQKQDVRHFKSVSLWNRTYDKVVELMARTVCTVYARLYVVVGDYNARGSSRGHFSRVSLSRSRVSSVGRGSFRKDASLRKSHSSTKNGYSHHRLGAKEEFHKNGRGFSFSCCNSASKVDDDDDDDNDDVIYDDDDDDESVQISSFIDAIDSDRSIRDHMMKSRGNLVNCQKFGPGSSLPPTTLGGSALALHYANIIIVLEKLLKYPHLVGDEARDDLYQMLPTSLRAKLKTSLGSYVTDLFIYDAPMAHHWRGRLDSMMIWLAPLAYNTMRWQNERNFEQQQIVTRTNVLLVQTLYFADREKTEAVVCEVLVGLNYMCRYEQQQNALVDCSSSFDSEDRFGASV
ncbi:hypothetical protein ABFS83_07G042600 [Erythranthe nasuta]